MSNFSRSIIIAGFVATAAGAGCADNVTTAIRPCPCAEGNVCCSSGVCAANQSACGAATAALSAQAVGDWVGYIENFTSAPFESGSDRMKLTLAAQPDGSLTGTVTLGTGSPPAAPTERDVGWPAAGSSIFIEGFGYSVNAPSWEALRLRGAFSTVEPWGQWCDLQTPIFSELTSELSYYACSPSYQKLSNGICVTTASPTTPDTIYDCGRLSLCDDGQCACDASHCFSAPTTIDDNTFDISLDGDRGDGSISLARLERGVYNIRLLRQ